MASRKELMPSLLRRPQNCCRPEMPPLHLGLRGVTGAEHWGLQELRGSMYRSVSLGVLCVVLQHPSSDWSCPCVCDRYTRSGGFFWDGSLDTPFHYLHLSLLLHLPMLSKVCGRFFVVAKRYTPLARLPCGGPEESRRVGAPPDSKSARHGTAQSAFTLCQKKKKEAALAPSSESTEARVIWSSEPLIFVSLLRRLVPAERLLFFWRGGGGAYLLIHLAVT